MNVCRRRRPSVWLLVMLLPALAACSGSDPVADEPAAPLSAPADAMARYAVVYEAVRDALEDVLSAVVWREKEQYPLVTEQPDGSCVLFLREDLGTGSDADELFDATDGLAALGDTLDPVLKEHGFSALTDPTTGEAGGAVSTMSSDASGWEVEIELEGTKLLMSTEGPVDAETCDESMLEQGTSGTAQSLL